MPHESKIIMEQIDSLSHNDWIDECGGPWGSLIVLAPKPHQEHVTDIKDFVWRMCVSYRKLNAVTLAFEYPIPRCDDAIDDFGDGFSRLWFISLDARQGYHQTRVRLTDRDKLAFFNVISIPIAYRISLDASGISFFAGNFFCASSASLSTHLSLSLR